MQYRTYQVPLWLDQPERILFVTVPVFVAGLITAGVCLLFLSLWMAVPAGIGVALILKRLTDGENMTVVQQWAYWNIPHSIAGWAAFPPSYKRVVAG